MKTIIRSTSTLILLMLFFIPSVISQSITIDNKAHRDIWVKLTWTNSAGSTVDQETPTLAYGKKHTFNLGSGARNIRGEAQFVNGLPNPFTGKKPWKVMGIPTMSGSGVLTYTGGPTAVPYGNFVAERGGGTASVESTDALHPGTGDSKLHMAARMGSVGEVESNLAISDKHVNTKNKKGNTPIHEAVNKGSIEVLQTLKNAGGNLNIKNNQGKSPMRLAVEKRNVEMVNFMIENGVNPSSDKESLKKAVQLGSVEIVSAFLDNRADPVLALEESMKRNKQTVFTTVMSHPDFQLTNTIFERAYQKGYKRYTDQMLDHPNLDMDVVMVIATSNKDKKMVAKALEKGGDPQRALEFAVNTNDVALVNAAVVQDGVDQNKVIETAAQSKNLSIVEALVSNGASAEKAMPIAVNNSDNKMVDYLMEYGVMADQYIETAVRKGNESMVKSMLGYVSGDLSKPLSASLETKNYTIAQALVENGAHTEQVLSTAVSEKQTRLLQAVLDQSNASETEMKNGLSQSVDQNNTQYVKMILGNYNSSIDNSFVEKAAANGNTDMITALVDAGGTPDAAMPLAIQKNDTNLTLFLLDKNADASKTAYITGAANNGNMEVVKALVDRGADVNPALPIAVNTNNTQLALYSLNNGANGSRDEYLVTSTRNKNQELVKAFLDQGVRADVALPAALETNYTTTVRQLIDAGANVSSPSLVQTAAAKCNSDIIKLLLDNGADPNQGMPQAVSRGKASIVSMFVNAGADGSKTSYIQTSTKSANVEVTKVLLEAGADPNQGIENAVGLNNTKLSRVLIDAGASVKDPKYIATASGNGNEELVKVMLKNGADANNGMGWAVKNNHTNTTMILLYNGADGTSSNYIITAAKNKNANIVSALIKAGADANAAVEPALRGSSVEVLRAARLGGADVTNPTYLAAAVKSSNIGIAGELLEGGSNPNKGFVDGSMSLLHQSIQNNSQNMMRLLISKGADVNAQTANGTSPLMLVVSKGKSYVSYANDLITAGADVNARDTGGEIVFQKAKSGKMKKLLKKSGASKK